MLTSRWFPLGLAIAQTVRHVGMIAYGYWDASVSLRNFAVEEFIRRDLARPLFDHYCFCGAWTDYSNALATTVSVDLPAYLIATILHSIVTQQISCVDALMTPRGQIITFAFIPFAWYLIGLSVRRIATRRWRPEAQGWLRGAVVGCGLLSASCGAMFLIWGSVDAVTAHGWNSIRIIATALWAFYGAVLAAERLRVWPFIRHSMQTN